MKISDDIIKDLAPAYLSGEASNDTIVFVEEYLKQNPKLKSFFEINSHQNGPQLEEKELDMDLSLLKKTKNYLRLKSIVLAFAIFTFASSFAILGNANEIKMFMWRDYPETASVLLIFSAICFYIYFSMRKKSEDFINH